MKNGFTLVELLAILVLLGVIILVSVPNIIETNKNSRQQNYEQYTNNIENAAEIYVETHTDKYQALKTTYNTSVTIKSEDLVAAGFIQGTLTNPKTDVQLINEASCVKVKNENGTLKYTYQASC